MELIFYLFRFILSLDALALKPLRAWVPDRQEILRNPAVALRQREIEIGPWTRYLLIYFLPVVLLVPVLFISVESESILLTILLSVAWLLLSRFLFASGRGGRCIIHDRGAEFHYGGVSVFCPWDVFCAAGKPIYRPEDHRLDLPLNLAALSRIEAWNDAGPLEGAATVRAGHLQVMPTGNLRLWCVYQVKPDELGDFLLALGRNLGRASDTTPAEQRGAMALPLSVSEDGWVLISLTRLVFPPICCDCGEPTESYQQFRCFPWAMTSELAISAEDCVTIGVPVCGPCQSRNRGRFWRTYSLTLVLTVVAGLAIGFLVGVILDLCGLTPGPGAMTIIMGGSGLLIGIALSWFIALHRARSASAPLALKHYRPTDGTIRLRFRNPRYLELLRQV
jgi:hypothetical protein